MIHAKGLRTFLLFATLSACCFSLLGAGCPQLGLFCTPMTECDNGETLEICISLNGTECGFQVGEEWFECGDCENFECNEAIESLLEVCTVDLPFTDLE